MSTISRKNLIYESARRVQFPVCNGAPWGRRGSPLCGLIPGATSGANGRIDRLSFREYSCPSLDSIQEVVSTKVTLFAHKYFVSDDRMGCGSRADFCRKKRQCVQMHSRIARMKTPRRAVDDAVRVKAACTNCKRLLLKALRAPLPLQQRRSPRSACDPSCPVIHRSTVNSAPHRADDSTALADFNRGSRTEGRSDALWRDVMQPAIHTPGVTLPAASSGSTSGGPDAGLVTCYHSGNHG